MPTGPQIKKFNPEAKTQLVHVPDVIIMTEHLYMSARRIHIGTKYCLINEFEVLNKPCLRHGATYFDLTETEKTAMLGLDINLAGQRYQLNGV